MDKQYYIGIDIGSTASKVVVTDDERLIDSFCLPTGWNSKETANTIFQIIYPVPQPAMAEYA